NTLVPLRVFIAGADDPSLNAVGSTSPPVVHFWFQYWTALPFAVSLTALPIVAAGLWRAMRRDLLLVASLVLVPFVLFAVYWGSFSTGLIREGLHVWLLTTLALVG